MKNTKKTVLITLSLMILFSLPLYVYATSQRGSLKQSTTEDYVDILDHNITIDNINSHDLSITDDDMYGDDHRVWDGDDRFDHRAWYDSSLDHNVWGDDPDGFESFISDDGKSGRSSFVMEGTTHTLESEEFDNGDVWLSKTKLSIISLIL